MSERPAVLMYNLDNSQKLKLLFVCSKLKIRCIDVAKANYTQPIGALAGLRNRTDACFTDEGFADEMLVMAHFTNQILNAFLGAMRQNHLPSIPLKAILTPTNAEWDSLHLHDEILREHNSMHTGK